MAPPEDRNSPDRDAVVAGMRDLFRDYELYDLTTDILAAWKYHIEERYPEAYVDLISAIGVVGEHDRFTPEQRPDFTASFATEDYGIIFEVKAAFSPGPENLADLLHQLRRYDERAFAFRLDPDGRRHHTPQTQDLVLVAPARSAAAIAAAIAADVARTRPFQKNMVMCQFEVQDEEAERTLFFLNFPVQGVQNKLRDGFLPSRRRLSHYLVESRVELRSSSFGHLRDVIVAGSDRGASPLGVAAKMLTLAVTFFGSQLRHTTFSESGPVNTIRFSIQDLLEKVRTPPYICGLPKALVREVLAMIAESAPFLSIDDQGETVSYTPQRTHRFSPFRGEEILQELPRKYGSGHLPVICYHLARGKLLAGAAPPPTSKFPCGTRQDTLW